jgi:hypothetical protein
LPFYTVPVVGMFEIPFRDRNQYRHLDSGRGHRLMQKNKTHGVVLPFFAFRKQLINGFLAVKSFRFGEETFHFRKFQQTKKATTMRGCKS